MKAHTFVTQWLCLMLAGMIPLQRNTVASSDPSDYKTIDDYVTARMRSERIPGLALAIVKGDQIVYLKGYGQADQSGRPVTPQTPFLIGSVTKSMTALAVMQLVEAGKVELDAPVQRYIPWFRDADPRSSAQITVRMLVNQTSGLPQAPTMVTWRWPDQPDAIERHVRLIATMKPVFPPGQSFGYSNANFATLGMILQVVSGQSYEEFIQQHVFAPLDMRNSYVSQDEAMQHGMSTGYRWILGFPVPVTLPFNRANLPAGFAIASAEDMAHYLLAQVNGGRYRDRSVLSPQGMELMQAEPPSGTYGMGWESVRIDGHRLINHDGATGNYQSSVFIDPQEHVGVFVAANAMSALDGLSSSRSTASLGARSFSEIVHSLWSGDRDPTILFSALITTRGMAHTLLSLTTGRPMPTQGMGQRQVSLIVDLVILALTGVLILSLVRLPYWYGQLAQHGIAGWSDLTSRTALIALVHFAWPLALLYVVLEVPSWIMLVLYQPDVVLWLESVAVIVFLRGVLEIALAWRVFSQIH